MRTATRMVVLNSKKYVLDLISAVVAAAYSLRRLYASYTGAAIRVRRSSDNAERDIGFIGEHLDVFALLAFVGNGNGFVTTWYDQSGNGRHATQITAGNQPQIVSAGVVLTKNGKATVLFDGSNDSLLTASAITSRSLNGVFSFRTGTVFPNYNSAVSQNSFSDDKSFIAQMGTTELRKESRGGGVITINGIVGEDFSPITSLKTATHVFSSNVTSAILIGNELGGAGRNWDGEISEVTAFGSTLTTTDRQTLERNQGIYFNISVS
jgi:trimeric autotransporter adhesin